MTRTIVAALITMGLLFGGAACDKEDQRDVQEVGNEVEKGVDKLDTDGKDD